VKFKIALLFLTISCQLMAANGGGDDAGNGGFAYKQSIKILEMATNELEHKVIDSDLPELKENPSWRAILQSSLAYDHLQKLYKKNAYRNGRKLAMDYVVNPPTVKVLKPYYEAFMGKTDQELESSSLEVQKRLLHEASHIWGYNEKESEIFAVRFLENAEQVETRPTNALDVVTACSCMNGKADSSNSCEKFCSEKPLTSSPILYITFAPKAEIALNPKLGNVYNWCNVQLERDVTAPQCFLLATDDNETISSIPVTINPGSNSVSANIQQLSFNRYYKFALYEGKTGSNAMSNAAAIMRKRQSQEDTVEPLQITTLNQYTCLFFGGENSTRTSFARQYFNFPGNETPSPLPPTPGNQPTQILCHDEQTHPGNDSAEYPRLEIIQKGSLFDKLDKRFSNDGSSLKINKLIEEKLLDDYNINVDLDLFQPLSAQAKPGDSRRMLGYVLAPFSNENGTYCPTKKSATSPLEFVINRFVGETEGLYIAEKEGEIIQSGAIYKTLYGTMFINESDLKSAAFTIENGIKKRTEDLRNKTIYFYWPLNNTMDPLIKANRRLFTIVRPDEVHGWTGMETLMTEDKKIGCIPTK